MHTPYSVWTSEQALDRDNKPFPFKVYTDVPAVALPRDIDELAWPAIGGLVHAPGADGAPLLHGGRQEKKPTPAAASLFRAAASTGALYHTENVPGRVGSPPTAATSSTTPSRRT